MPVIEPGRRSPSWEKVRSRSRFSCSSWDRVGGIGTSITERTIYVQKPATKKNGLTFAISMSHTQLRRDDCARWNNMMNADWPERPWIRVKDRKQITPDERV